jgi:hypothetical protein
MADQWPWLALAGLGAFHGLNPGMGWLFAVALGLHRQDPRMVWLSLGPIALGHALSIALVVAIFVWAGFLLDGRGLRVLAALLLVGWGLYHWRYGHRHRVRFGMRTGLAGLAAWSFLMATAHGAGVMLWPALMPLCVAAASGSSGAADTWTVALAGVAVHSLAMLMVMAAVAGAVYRWIGLEVLRHAWLNVDLIWTLTLVAAGIALLVW